MSQKRRVMQYVSKEESFLSHEKVQIGIRVAILSMVSIVLPAIGITSLQIEDVRISLFVITGGLFLLNGIYFTYILRYPFRFQRTRILLFAVLDVLATVLVMAYVGDISAYFAWLLLWYVVGYGVRYDALIGYSIYITVLLSWLYLSVSIPYWVEHPAWAAGWFFAYMILPLYYFKLVDALKEKIEELHLIAKENVYKAEHDPLTELPNRFSFSLELQRYMKRQKPFALLFIDLDGFKNINDTYGHDVGDKVLVEVTKRMREQNVYVARLGGDEFAAIVPFEEEEDVCAVAQSIIDSIRSQWNNPTLRLSASIGISLFPKDAKKEFQLKKMADQAMYRAKIEGKGRFMFYNRVAKETSTRETA